MRKPSVLVHGVAVPFAILVATLAAAAEPPPVALSGTVRDAAGAPVADALVAVPGTTLEVRTDAAGAFRLDLTAGFCTLRVTHPEYETATRTLEVAADLPGVEIVLTPRPRFSHAVTVRAVRADALAPVTATDLDAQQIAETNVGQELPFVLEQAVPSLTRYSDSGLGAGYSYLYLRGIQQTRINLTLDGVPLNEPEDSALYFANFADFASVLESLQVQRGVGTSAPGAASFVGSINFESVALAERPQVGGRVGAGSYGTSRLALEAHSGSVGPELRFYVRAARHETDGYKRNSAVAQDSVFFGATHVGDRSYLKLFGFDGRESTQLAFLATDEATLASDPRFNALSPEERDRFGQRFLQLQYHYALDPQAELSVQGYYNGADGWYRLWEDPAARDALLEYGLEWRTLGATASLTRRRGGLSLTWGAHLNDFDSQHGQSVVSGAERYRNRGAKNEASSFVKLGLDHGSWHHYADVQVRWARFRYSGDVPIDEVSWAFVNPKIGTRLDVGPGLGVYASLGSARREPTRSDMFSGEDNPTLPYDPEAVRPERVLDLEVGTDWRRPGLDLELSAYAMEFHDEIALTGELSAIGLPVRRNVDDSYRRGVELALAWRPLPTLRLRHTASANAAEIRSWQQFYDVYDEQGAFLETTSIVHRDVRPLLTPAFVGTLAVDYSPLDRLQLGLAGRYVSASQLDNTNDSRFRAPAYFDLGGSVAVGLGRETSPGSPRLRVELTNLLDSAQRPSGYSYPFVTRDALGGETIDGIRYFYPAAARAVFVTLELGD